jgi:hypothetical protein
MAVRAILDKRQRFIFINCISHVYLLERVLLLYTDTI